MKKYVTFFALLLVSALTHAAAVCPCPGACCPTVDNVKGLTHMAEYLAPWSTQSQTTQLMENDLAKHRTH